MVAYLSTLAIVFFLSTVCSLDIGSQNVIVPDAKLCKERTQCNTLENYLQMNQTIFSTPNTVWVFLQGTFYLESDLIIANAWNVTLRGEEACVQDSSKCTIVLKTTVQINSDALIPRTVHLSFRFSRQITVSSLHLTSMILSTETMCETPTVMYSDAVSFIDVSDVVISGVDFDFSEWSYDHAFSIHPHSVLISGPSGSYKVTNCTFQGVYRVVFNVLDCPTGPGDPLFSLLMTHSVMDRFGQFAFLAGSQLPCQTISVTIVSCIFSNGEQFDSLSSLLDFRLLNSNIKSFHLDDSRFFNTVSVTYPVLTLRLPLLHMPYNGDLESLCMGTPIQLSNCIFRNNSGGVAIEIDASAAEPLGNYSLVSVINTTFADNHAEDFIFQARLHNGGIDCWGSVECTLSTPLLCFDGVVFTGNAHYATSLTPATVDSIVHFSNFWEFPVYFSGRNEIISNSGCGLQLANTILILSDTTEVHLNTGKLPNSCGGVHISQESMFILINGSVLNISSNKAPLAGGGIRMSPNTLDYLAKPDMSCDFCFVMLSDEFGHPASPKEVDARVLLDHNHAQIGKDIYSSFNYTCGNLIDNKFNDSYLQKIVNPMVWNTESISSAPFRICVCDQSNTSIVDCGIRDIHIHQYVYPSDSWKLLVTVVGLFDSVLPSDVFVNVGRGLGGDLIHFKTNICTSVLSLEPSSMQQFGNNASHEVRLSAPPLYPDSEMFREGAFLERVITVNLTLLECPPGFMEHVIGNSSLCTCNPLLSQHNFQCSISGSVVRYKSTKPHYWISLAGDSSSIIFSDYCPPQYCTSLLLDEGITLEDLKTDTDKQCAHGYKGLLCSIQFNCFHILYPQIAVLVIASVMIVTVMFLLNVSLRTGTINGFSLYSNILILLTRYETLKPLSVIASFMNLEFNIGTCLIHTFNGFENQWTFFQLTFPLLCLLGTELLLILFFLCFHACCRKCLSFSTLIKETAIPVLGVTILLTFTNILRSIIDVLSHTSTYSSTEVSNVTFRWIQVPHFLYFQGVHLAVGIVSIVLILFYILPFIFVVLTADCLRMFVKHKFILDAFRGPFHGLLGFWFGIRVIFRIIVTLVGHFANDVTLAIFVFISLSFLVFLQLLLKPFRNPVKSDEVYKLSRASVCSPKAVLLDLAKKFFHPRTLDHLFLLNMIVATIPIIVQASPSAIRVVFSISMGLALIQLLAILAYHSVNRFLMSRWNCNSCKRRKPVSMRMSNVTTTDRENPETVAETNCDVSTLKEPLIV